jgi:hypothetical protein
MKASTAQTVGRRMCRRVVRFLSRSLVIICGPGRVESASRRSTGDHPVSDFGSRRGVLQKPLEIVPLGTASHRSACRGRLTARRRSVEFADLLLQSEERRCPDSSYARKQRRRLSSWRERRRRSRGVGSHRSLVAQSGHREQTRRPAPRAGPRAAGVPRDARRQRPDAIDHH